LVYVSFSYSFSAGCAGARRGVYLVDKLGQHEIEWVFGGINKLWADAADKIPQPRVLPL
jgi:hypothetical protein